MPPPNHSLEIRIVLQNYREHFCTTIRPPHLDTSTFRLARVAPRDRHLMLNAVEAMFDEAGELTVEVQAAGSHLMLSVPSLSRSGMGWPSAVPC